MSLAQRAAGRWRELYSGFPELSEAMAKAPRHVTCPIHGGQDGFRLFRDWEQSGGGVCNTCGTYCDGVSLLQWLLSEGFRQVAERIESVVGKDPNWKPDPEVEKNRLRLQKIQELARKPGDAVAAYLGARGLEVPPGILEGTLAYWEGAERRGEYQAMLGKFVSPSGKPVTWHVTYLQGSDKAKVEEARKVMSPIDAESGGAIRLYPAAEVMGIAEGIETAIAAKMLFGVPVWAAMNAGMLEKFTPPQQCKRLLIFGDNDASCAGQAAAYRLAARMYNRVDYRDVRIPSALGQDWNDVLTLQSRRAA